MSLSSEQIKEKATSLGFHKVGIATANNEEQIQAQTRLKNWLAAGYHADMKWMDNPKRFDLQKCLPGVQSVIAVALNYYTPYAQPENPEQGKISRYAWGRDYHKVMQKKLKALASWLQEQAPEQRSRYYSDTGPVQDKFWAQQAGLGWIAKNSNVITREYGSWVFLGEVLTTLPLTPDSPHTEHCGSCTRCLEACPTNAFPQPFVVDANRCIAYHTIENRDETLPEEIDLNGWVAGCDICQEVCPWNQRFAKETDCADFQPRSEHLAPNLVELAQLPAESWDQKTRGSALRRIKADMWRRNARANLEEHGTQTPSETC
ncbi:MAG: tRNA epoxyqueuosine(34) reductase QueG [Cyanobacteria bacterium]|jgi:epoxyqueuosine reductase|nr:tRNA epoxyqueuosine(34) reductase QueG [Cyanobacteria bacterium GSL.Bin21]